MIPGLKLVTTTLKVSSLEAYSLLHFKTQTNFTVASDLCSLGAKEVRWRLAV